MYLVTTDFEGSKLVHEGIERQLIELDASLLSRLSPWSRGKRGDRNVCGASTVVQLSRKHATWGQ